MPPMLLCSRHNPAFLQRTGSGSHLYSANLHTLRSGHGAEVLLALVGTHLFVVALPSPFVLLLYHRSCGLSRVFLTFFFGGRWWELNPHSPKANVSEIANLLYLSFLAEVVRSTSSPSVPLLYHTSRDLSRGFLNFFVR